MKKKTDDLIQLALGLFSIHVDKCAGTRKPVCKRKCISCKWSASGCGLLLCGKIPQIKDTRRYKCGRPPVSKRVNIYVSLVLNDSHTFPHACPRVWKTNLTLPLRHSPSPVKLPQYIYCMYGTCINSWEHISVKADLTSSDSYHIVVSGTCSPVQGGLWNSYGVS